MTRDDIIRMAREAGCEPMKLKSMLGGPVTYPTDAAIERFAALVAAAEREACRTIAADYAQKHNSMTAVNIADAIRARGQA